jgi:cysteinyl-tRNA synthetase
MRLFNTLTRQEEPFAPARDNTVRMYTCGLTVYNRGHIGNFRSFIAADVLRRTLKYLCGFQVRQVMNFTDVDDRTIAGAEQAGTPLREYTEQYIEAFREDMQTLGLEWPEETPRATDEANLRAMTEMIRALEARGHTYVSDGSVYYRIASFPGYGRLARLDQEGIKPGARVDADSYTKENARDFVLWKATRPASRPGITASARGVRAGTSSARRWPCVCSARRRSTSTPAASISSSRTTRTRSRRARGRPGLRSPGSGCTSSTCRSTSRRCRSRSGTSST